MKEMLKTLTRRTFAANRGQNFIAVLAIALTATLFTSVTTIGAGTMQSLSLTMQMLKLSRGDAELHNMSLEQFEALKKEDFVKNAGMRMPVAFLSNTIRHNVELDVMDETEAELVFASPTHGRFPQAANEVVTSDRALRDLGAEPETGAEITIAFTAHGKEYVLPMVVSGWYESVSDQVSYLVAGTAFRDANPDIFRNTYKQDKELAGVYFSDITVTNTLHLQEKLDKFSRSQGGSPDDMQAPNYLPGIINQAKNPAPDGTTLAAGAMFLLLFVFCGYLLIYNVFDIAVMQDIRRYGLYRTIGMSRRQVKELINRQALWLTCTGLPIGLLAGFLVGRSSMPVIMSSLDTEYNHIAVQISPSFSIFATAAFLTAFTVFLSTRKPVRTAAGIPPAQAFRYVETSLLKAKKKRSRETATIPQMALSNLGRNKRRSAFIIISLMLCVVLLNCVGTAANSVDIEKQVAQMIRTDFAILNAGSMSNQQGFTSRDMALSEQTIADISSQKGVINGTAVYKNTLEDTNVTYDFDVELPISSNSPYSGLLAGVTENGVVFNLGDDGKPICNVYGMEEASIERMNILEGEKDPHILYGQMCNGEGVLLGVKGKMGTKAMNPVFDLLETGDRIAVYKNGQQIKEFSVLAKAVTNGDDEEVGYTVGGPVRVGGDGLFLYLPTEIYKEIYDEPVIYKYSFDIEESQRKNMSVFLDNYMETKDMSINYLSADSARAVAQTSRNIIHFVGGAIGLIFGFAGILNLVNMLITSILARRHEFATMQSIGMTQKQLAQMMTLEGLWYALGAASLGIALSLLLDLTLVRSIIDKRWNFTFHLTLAPAIITSIILLAFAALVPSLVLRQFHKGSIVEQLHVSEF